MNNPINELENIGSYDILIVEDELAIRMSLVDLMEISGFQVRSAENGLEGVRKVQEKTPDLIISDVMMPELDGYGFLEEIRANKETTLIPFIFLTAKVELESKLQGMELGADGYITKPFEFRELNLKVRNLLITKQKVLQNALTKPGLVKEHSQDTIILKKLNLIMEEQLENSELTTDQLAISLNMSLSTFTRKLKKLSNKSPNQFMKEFRLIRAKQMVELSYGSLSEIARKTGFSTLSYFSHSYKEFYGKSPSEETSN
ncbi:response regulator [Flavobacteriales bacterium]|nr:response regulator [Flavobacteriales bacterium]